MNDVRAVCVGNTKGRKPEEHPYLGRVSIIHLFRSVTAFREFQMRRGRASGSRRTSRLEDILDCCSRSVVLRKRPSYSSPSDWPLSPIVVFEKASQPKYELLGGYVRT